MIKKNILFVCSGNVFRSMSAKYCLENFCKLNNIKNISCDSAGINVGKNKQFIKEEVKQELLKLGININSHKPKNVSEINLNKFDLIIAMGYNHKKFLKDKFNIDSVLFNKVCYDVNYPVYDNNEVLSYHKGFVGALYNVQIVKYISKSIPFFTKNYINFLK